MYKFSGPKIICIISVVSVETPPVLTDQTSGGRRQTGTGGDIILLYGNLGTERQGRGIFLALWEHRDRRKIILLSGNTEAGGKSIYSLGQGRYHLTL